MIRFHSVPETAHTIGFIITGVPTSSALIRTYNTSFENICKPLFIHSSLGCVRVPTLVAIYLSSLRPCG